MVTIPPAILIESPSPGGIIAVNGEWLDVRLRRATAADAEVVSRWRNQPDVFRFQAGPRRTIAQVRDMLAAQDGHARSDPTRSASFYWIVEGDGGPCGQVQLAVDPGFRRQLMATLGYTVAEEMQAARRRDRSGAAGDLDRVRGQAVCGFGRIEAVAAVENLDRGECSRRPGFSSRVSGAAYCG